MSTWIYAFGDGVADDRAAMRDLLGGKGANLAEMANFGLPVPPGFTITTEVCAAFLASDSRYPDDLAGAVEAALTRIEELVGARFGDPALPLLVSVRSGARASMPGMMDTVLNLGLNDQTVAGLAAASGDARFAWDSYRRFIQMYGNVVLSLDHNGFEDILESHKQDRGYIDDPELSGDDWQDVVAAYKSYVEAELGSPFPQDPRSQLWGAIGAVFNSWTNQRANTYRRLHNIPESWGTAVNVQSMVFGNMGDDCATGVAFTRDPSTGASGIFGEFLVNAQGEDVVAGIRTPQPIVKSPGDARPAMEELMPAAFGELVDVASRLEAHYQDMQDIEFTVQAGKLWMLQTRSRKRTAAAALKIAVDMVAEGVIDQRRAVASIDPASLDQVLHPTLDPTAVRDLIVTGLPASPGAAVGKIVFTADEAEQRAEQGEEVILVRAETSPEDIHGMHAAKAIVTSRGGMTSHAAVVARGMGRPCVCGAGSLLIDAEQEQMSVGDRILGKGNVITVDGGVGEVLLGEVPTIQPVLSGDFSTVMAWADTYRRLRVRTNAETPHDAEVAVGFGAEGIGLCRTEHMFFDAERIVSVREMILASNTEGRRRALEKLLPMQRQDFAELFRIMEERPVTIRLLDPPLHEFLPQSPDEIATVAEAIGLDAAQLRRHIAELHEANPMLGHRGCCLGISYPEIYEMQARAILEAADEVARESGTAPVLEIMIPLIATKAELDIIKGYIDRVAAAIAEQHGKKPSYLVGTMIELPRAALRAGDIAETAEFFSFGTNDLTQTTFGISRDDAASFLGEYERAGILETDPFASLDIEGVGELLTLASERGRATRADLKLGICGEHGGRSRVGPFLSHDRPRSRIVLTLPRSDRTLGRRASGVS